jgi:serine/threonine-protein kinase
VVHRDIKPDNILLSGRHALVADFGVAKAISESTGKGAVTTIGVALGTPAYMAPEQAAADPHVDHRADIYALGIVGYEMLTGEPPFVRRSPHEVLAAHVTETPPPVSVRRQSVPPALEALIAKCLLKQPADRFQSAHEVEAELERVMTPSGGMSPAAGMAPKGAMTAAIGAQPDGLLVMRRVGIVATAVVVIAAGWFAVAKLRGGAPNRQVVAVFPFEYNGGPELAYLKEGIVNVLEANLTGEGGPRAVASQTIIAQWKRRGGADRGLTEEEARALATELGAGQLLRGSIVVAGTELVISATLAATSGGGQPVQAQVQGPSDSIASLATRLASQLVSLRVGEAADRLSRLQGVPPAALRAYLVGQQALRDSRFLDAYNAFGNALGRDSTFALAAMGMSTAQSFSAVSVGTGNSILVAYRHRDRLGPRDSIILHMRLPATFAGRPLSLREATDIRERLVKEVSDRPEAWYLIGDNYFHRGNAMGITLDEAHRRAESAFRRVLALDPELSYVKLHLVHIERGHDINRMKQVADSLGLRKPEIDIVVRITAGDSVDVGKYRAEFATLNVDQLADIFYQTAGTPVGESAYEAALAKSADAGQRRALVTGARELFWSEGRPARAKSEHERLMALAQSPAQLIPSQTIIAALFEGGDSTQANEAAAVLATDIGLSPGKSDRVAFADRTPALLAGMWAVKANAQVVLAAALARLDAIAARRDSLPYGAIARLYADALRLISTVGPPDRLRLAAFDSSMSQGPPVSTSEQRAALNMVAAFSWERLREYRRAAMAAERAATWDVSALVQATARRDLGRFRLAAGDTSGAARTWRLYLDRRSMAEPSQRRLDDEIRAKLAEIEKKKR